ncbi:MAG: hypothetical protein AAF587_15505 [Bacteroidota bacterium]
MNTKRTSFKAYVYRLIAAGRIRDAIRELIDWVNHKNNNQDLLHRILIVSGMFEMLESVANMQLLPYFEYRMGIARHLKQILELLEEATAE